jgi:hypothetical protein
MKSKTGIAKGLSSYPGRDGEGEGGGWGKVMIRIMVWGEVMIRVWGKVMVMIRVGGKVMIRVGCKVD